LFYVHALNGPLILITLVQTRDEIKNSTLPFQLQSILTENLIY